MISIEEERGREYTELNLLNNGNIAWDFTNDYCCIKNIKSS